MSARLSSAALVLLATSMALGFCGIICYTDGRRTEPLIRFLDPRLTPVVDEAFIAIPVEYALRSTEANDVIFLGDSSCRHDVDPATLPGIRSYNLGIVGSAGETGMRLITTAYLQHHPKPSAIFICISPIRLEIAQGTGGGHVLRRFLGSYGPEVPGMVSPLEAALYFTRRGALSVGGRGDDGHRLLDGPLRGMEGETFLSLQSKLAARRGFYALPGERGVNWGLDPPAKTFILPEWTDGLSRLNRLCRDNGVCVVIRFAPIYDGLSKSRDFSLLDQWANSIEESNPGLTVSRPILLAWDRSLMWDGTHLNKDGIKRFAAILAADIHRVLSHD